MPDIFICHASEDKLMVAQPLADMLKSAGLDVWFDEYSLKLGDSLHQTIENGLSQSQYGVIIISPSFFAKKWPQAELNGLFAREIAGQCTILPIWHNIDKETIVINSPILADKVAARTDEGMDKVVYKILDVIRPDNKYLYLSDSTLTITPARIHLHTGEWAVKTPLRITNLSDKPAYSVQVKLTLDPPNLDPNSIIIKLDKATTLCDMMVSNKGFSSDAYILNFLDKNDQECIAIILHTIDAHTTREILVSGTKNILSSAEIKIWDFKDIPPELLKKGNKISFPFTVPEEVKTQSLFLLNKKKGT
jgi:hypothetical protein